MRENSYNKRKVESFLSSAAGNALEAFPELVRSHSKLIYRVSLGILKNHADAEDNLQNVLIKAYSNIHRFEGRSQLSSWLVRIAINEALMKIRKRRVAGGNTEAAKDGDLEALKVEDSRANPEHQCIVNDLAAKALGCLSPYLQDTFVLSATEGWTAQELANVMGVSIVAIKTRIFRARTRMRYHLASLTETGNKSTLKESSPR